MTHHLIPRLRLVLGCSILLSALSALGQSHSGDALQRQGYAPAERTALRTRWVRVVTTNGACMTNVVDVLAPGQNRLVAGRWVPSDPELVPGPDGQGIIGRGAGHTAWFPTNLTDSAILIIDHGQRVRLKFAGIAYEDSVSGTNVLLAEAKPSGAVLGTNSVTYRDATTDFRCAVTYRYSAAGVSQTLTFQQRPPEPEAFGLDPATVRIVALSEIVEGPSEQTTERSWRFGRETERDQTISFGGSMTMVPGFAFGSERALSPQRYRVTKRVEHYQGGRRAIAESIPYRQIRRELMRLPSATTGGATNASLANPERWFASRLPIPPTVTGAPFIAPLEAAMPGRASAAFASGTEMVHTTANSLIDEMPALEGTGRGDRTGTLTNAAGARRLISASSDNPAPGFSLDWDYVYSDEGYWFQWGGTAVVEGEVHLPWAGFEVPTTVKFDDGASLYIDGSAELDFWYGNIVLTSIHDDDHGEFIEVDYEAPYDGMFGPALVVQPDDYDSVSSVCEVYYGSPGVVAAMPPPSTVSVVATDPRATKGGSDNGTVTIVRADGDWGSSLTVHLSFSGTATAGTDYQSIGATAVIPAEEDGVDIAVHPLSGSGDFLKTLRITVVADSGGTYNVGSPDGATVEIYNPAATPPSPSGVPSGIAAWWRAEGDAADSLGSTPGLSSGFQLAPGLVGQGFELDGVDECVTLPSTAALNPSGSFTIEAWIFPRADQHSVIVGKWGWEGDYYNLRSYVLGPDTGRGVAFNISDASHQWDGAFHAFTAAGVLTLNAWNHVAGVYDQSTGTRRIYVNGVQVGQRVDVPAITVLSSSCKTAIGAYYPDGAATDSPFYGMIDEVAFYNRALASAEIAAIYNARSTGKAGGPVIVTQPASQTVYPGDVPVLTVLAYGALPLNYQWSLNGAAIPGATASSLVLADVQPSTAGIYAVTVVNTLGSASSANAALVVGQSRPCAGAPANLVACWAGENSADDVAGGLNGTLVNGTGFAAGQVGTAFSFNSAANQCVSVPSSGSLNPSGSFTIEGWLYPNNDQSAVVFGKWGDSGDYGNMRSYVISTELNRTLTFGISDSPHQWDSSFHSFAAPCSLSLNAWNHVAAVYDQGTGTRRLYVNGVEVAERSDSPITVLSTTAKLALGARYSSSTSVVSPFNGRMDEFAFYSRALTGGEISALCAARSSGKCLLPAAWQMQYFGQTGVDPSDDPDGDGYTNAQEYRNGTDPTIADCRLAPGYLRCEYRENPWGVDTRAGGSSPFRPPRLYWVVTSPRRAELQAAYQVLVASSETSLNANNGDLWDSGKVLSDQTTHVEFGNIGTHQNLQSNERCWWKVRVWDKPNGLPSPWSTNAFFQIGLVDGAADWTGVQWIGVSGYNGVCPMFRRTFVQRDQILHATAYASAKGVYELWVNGQKVGKNKLAPEWTDYNKRIQYQAFDITSVLVSGSETSTNVVGAVVGEGWASGYGQIGNNRWGANPQLALKLVIETSAGTTAITTDPTWTAYGGGAINSASIWDGEAIDARKQGFTPEWSTVSYSHANIFATSATVASPLTPSLMVGQPDDPIQVVQEITPVDFWYVNNPDGTTRWMFDMGQNMVGWCRLTLATGGTMPGRIVSVEHGEVPTLDTSTHLPQDKPGLDFDNHSLHAYVNNGWAAQAERYTLNADSTQEFEPHFTYHGFRYVRVTGPSGLALTISSIAGLVVRNSMRQAGTFSCSDANVNKLMSNILWTQWGNTMGVPTDCPQRTERFGYLGDAQIFAQTACFNADMAAFYSKFCRDMFDAQRSSGSYPNCAPDNGLVGSQWDDIGWASASLMIPWRLYQNYGDTRVLDEAYNPGKKYMSFLAGTFPASYIDPDGAYSFAHAGDWMCGGFVGQYTGLPASWNDPYNGQANSGVHGNVYEAGFYRYTAQIADSVATIVDPAYDGSYHTLAENIKSAFNSHPTQLRITFDPISGGITSIGDGSQGDFVTALFFDLLPTSPIDQRAACLDRLINKQWSGIANYNKHYQTSQANHLSGGFQSAGREMLELTADGRTDVAYTLLMQKEFPSWLYNITKGDISKYQETTISERWDAYLAGISGNNYRQGDNSFNHYALGSVGEWIWRTVVGINPDDANPGFKNIILKPETDDRPPPAVDRITRGEGQHRSIRGVIACSWAVNPDNTKTYKVTVPPNTQASLYLSVTNPDHILESGFPLTGAPWLLAAPAVTGGRTLLRLGSGSFCFTTWE